MNNTKENKKTMKDFVAVKVMEVHQKLQSFKEIHEDEEIPIPDSLLKLLNNSLISSERIKQKKAGDIDVFKTVHKIRHNIFLHIGCTYAKCYKQNTFIILKDDDDENLANGLNEIKKYLKCNL